MKLGDVYLPRFVSLFRLYHDMLPKLAVGLHFCLLAVNALPQPPDWHMGWFPTQQTLDVGAGKIKHLVDWISSNADYGIRQEYRPYGAPNENENKTVWQVLNDNPECVSPSRMRPVLTCALPDSPRYSRRSTLPTKVW